jgi:hypothetical protein
MEGEQPQQTTPGPVQFERPALDWQLQSLVNMVNQHEIEIGITLILGGTVITGTLIGGRQYFETFSANFAGAWPVDDEEKERLREALSAPAKMYASGEVDPAGPSFIHLGGATVRTPGGILFGDGALWRGRLSEISGFVLGKVA